MRVLDILGHLRRRLPLDTSQAARDWVTDQGGRRAGHGARDARAVPASLAAFVNGVLAHSLDYDDTHLPSVLHPSACIVPAALAVAEALGADGRASSSAIAAGLEICVRLGMAGYDQAAAQLGVLRTRPARHLHLRHGRRGCSRRCCWASTPTASSHAMGIAASMASGIIEANRHRRLGQADALRLGRARRRFPRPAARAGVSPARRRCSRADSASSRPGLHGELRPSRP